MICVKKLSKLCERIILKNNKLLLFYYEIKLKSKYKKLYIVIEIKEQKTIKVMLRLLIIWKDKCN